MPGARFVSTHLDMTGCKGVLVEARRSPDSADVREPVVVIVLGADEKTMWVEEGSRLFLKAGESARARVPTTRGLVRIEVEVPDGLPQAHLDVRLTRLPRMGAEAQGAGPCP